MSRQRGSHEVSRIQPDEHKSWLQVRFLTMNQIQVHRVDEGDLKA